MARSWHVNSGCAHLWWLHVQWSYSGSNHVELFHNRVWVVVVCSLTIHLKVWVSVDLLFWNCAFFNVLRICGNHFLFFNLSDTPRHMYFVHTFTWMLNMFGIFFILSAHEHYSIDVFIAFYITSRLFLYYHTLANNRSLMIRDSNRTRIWFPLFSYLESSVSISSSSISYSLAVLNLFC